MHIVHVRIIQFQYTGNHVIFFCVEIKGNHMIYLQKRRASFQQACPCIMIGKKETNTAFLLDDELR